VRIVATDTIVSRLTFETLLPVFPTGESARQGAGLTLGMRAQFTMRKEGLSAHGLHRAAQEQAKRVAQPLLWKVE